MDHRDEGWSRRRNVKSIVWHFFRAGIAVCPKQWGDAEGPMRPSLPPGSKPCPKCVAVLAGGR